MPGRQSLGAEILEHEHRTTGGELRDHLIGGGRKHIRQSTVAARRADHLELETAAESRNEDLRRNRPRLHLDTARTQECRERCGPALIVFLRIKRHRAQLD